MALLPVTLNDLEGLFLLFELWNLYNSHTLGIILGIIYDMFTHDQNAHMACDFNHLFENEGLLKVTDSHIHCICGKLCNIMETVPDVTTDHYLEVYMACRIEAIPLTLFEAGCRMTLVCSKIGKNGLFVSYIVVVVQVLVTA